MKTPSWNLWKLSVLAVWFALSAPGRLIWMDGSLDPADQPPGKLLSDNEDYWGESVLTGVEYTYRHQPDGPRENRLSRTGKPQRILLNGCRGKGIGIRKDVPLVITFDFKQPCRFAEWDVVSPSKSFDCTLEISADGETFTPMFNRSQKDCPPQLLHRIKLPSRPEGRYVRLTMKASGRTLLDQIMAWGDAVNPQAFSETYAPSDKGGYPIGVVYPSVPGIGKSSVSDREAFYWKKSLTGELLQQDAVWFTVPTWDCITDRPLLPKVSDINRPIRIIMARNECEHVAIAIRNTSVSKPRTVVVNCESVKDSSGRTAGTVTADLGIFGAIGDLGFGNNLGPIFKRGNMLGESLMRKHVLNGHWIRRFPEVRLTPSGAAVMWLTVTSKMAKPGNYQSTLSLKNGTKVPLQIHVLDVTLPKSTAFVHAYSTCFTRMFPFVHEDRALRDCRYALDCGIRQFYRFTMCSDHERDVVTAEAARQGINLLDNAGRLVPGLFTHHIWCWHWKSAKDFPPDAATQVKKHVAAMVEKMEKAGVSYDQWYGEISDEPSAGNMAAIAEACRLIKEADPKVNVYVNPCYWVSYNKNAVAEDEIVAPQLKEWYRKYVDISMPLYFLLQDRPQSFKELAAPRKVNSFYLVSSQLDRSESSREIQKYRKMAWESMRMGLNGWSFYSYHSPRGSAWDHFDRNPRGEGLREPSDYSMVYPGYRGVVPTRQSEALRQGKEDWQLLNLLMSQGKRDFVRKLVLRAQQGEELTHLREIALREAVKSRKRSPGK